MVDRINTRIRGPIAAIKAWVFGHSYTARVTVTFALIAGLTAIVAMGVLSFVWEQHFQNYTHENIQALADRTASAIADKYEKSNGHALDIVNTTGKGTYPPLTMSDVSPASAAHTLNQTMGIQVVGINNTIVYDSTVVMTGSDALAPNKTQSLAPGSDATMAHADIMVNGTAIGRVNMWVYGSDVLLSKTDQEFRNRSYQAMAFAAVLSIVLASLLGFLFARSLVHPISRMTETAAAIKEGDLSARTNLEGDDEIAELGKTFDAMAASVEKDRELERRLTTDVAHELRTPLAIMRGELEAVEDGLQPLDQRVVQSLQSEVGILSKLVDDIHMLSMTEVAPLAYHWEQVDVVGLLDATLSSWQERLAVRGLSLKRVGVIDRMLVSGDPNRLRQVFQNLLENAVRYVDQGGTVQVGCQAGSPGVIIDFDDSGPGMPPEDYPRLFDRFYRREASRNRATGGSGLGLAICRGIVEAHGGRIMAQASPLGGLRVRIELPPEHSSEGNG